MSRRAYRPRRSTIDLVRALQRLAAVDSVEIIAPNHLSSGTIPASLRIYLTRRWPGERAYLDLSMAQARAWLAERAAIG